MRCGGVPRGVSELQAFRALFQGPARAGRGAADDFYELEDFSSDASDDDQVQQKATQI